MAEELIHWEDGEKSCAAGYAGYKAAAWHWVWGLMQYWMGTGNLKGHRKQTG